MTSKTVIIGGCGSSGTTLLAHLLSANSAILVGPELNFFNHKFLLSESHLKAWSSTARRWKPEPFAYFYPDRLLTGLDFYKVHSTEIKYIAQGACSVKQFYDGVESLFLTKSRKEIWFEKTPSNCYMFSSFSEFDSRKMILVVRDPRDVITSLKRRGFPLLVCACRWLFDTLIGLTGQFGSNLCLVKYEDLTREPDKVIPNVLRFSGIHSTIIEQHGTTSPSFNENWSESSERKNWNFTPADPVSNRNTGKWKHLLDEEEILLISNVRLRDEVCEKFGLPSCSILELAHGLGYSLSADGQRSWCDFPDLRAIHELQEEHADRERKAISDGLGRWKMRYPTFKSTPLLSEEDPPTERIASVIDALTLSLQDICIMSEYRL